MTELPNQEEVIDRKLEGEELAKAARNLRDQFSLYYKTPILENVKTYFVTNGVERMIENKVVGDQQQLYVDARDGEYVEILVARGSSGINGIHYSGHGIGRTDFEDSERAIEVAQKVFEKIFPI